MIEILHCDSRVADSATHEKFVDLLCADEDLVRAEFEEIITAEWPTPPTDRPSCGAGAQPRPPERRTRRPRRVAGAPARPDPSVVGARTRERSPPAGGATDSHLLVPAAQRPGPGPLRHAPDHGRATMNARPRDLYAVLGVPENATRTEIDRAFRALLRRHHPDSRQAGDESQSAQSDATLQEVFTAYSVLGDPAHRVAYDRDSATASHRAPVTPPAARTRRPDEQPPIVAGPVRWYPAGRRS